MHARWWPKARERRRQRHHGPSSGFSASPKSPRRAESVAAIVAAVLALAGLWSPRTAHAQPHQFGAELWGQANPNDGLIVLQGSTRKYPYVDAEALVWGGIGASQVGFDDDPRFEALVVTMRVRDPRGVSDTRLGRFILATGAVRAVHLDGGHLTLRAPSRTHVELFGGVPVDGDIEGRSSDWLAGGRVSQGIGKWGVIGGSYYARFNAGQRSDEEVGADLSIRVARWLDMAARFSWELVNPGLAEVLATVSSETKNRAVRGELYVTKRSPTRMIQQTSLFTVLGDPGTLAAGANIRWRAAPRLDLWVDGALRNAREAFGWSGSLRGVLRTDDEGKGSILGELRRQAVTISRWTGIRLAAVIPVYEDHDTTVGLMPEFEVIIPDDPQPGQGNVWPWGRLAIRWQPGPRWFVSAACEAGANQVQRYEVRGLARVAYQGKWPKQ